MLPFHAPPGTSVRDYILRLVPDAHRNLVPKGDGTKRWDISVTVPGETSARYRIDGGELWVDEERSDAHVALILEKDHVERFLADWAGPKRWVPKFEPRGAALVTDPRVLSRVALVNGSLEAIVPDLDGSPVKVVVAAFGGKLGAFEPGIDEPDAKIEVTNRTFEAMLAGTLAPDEALSSGEVAVRGRKLVAMQLAFALAPFFPAR